MFLGHGIYHILNAVTVGVRIALANNGKPVTSSSVDGTALPDTFSIINIVSGTHMDQTGGSGANGTPVIGYHGTGNDNQKWIIRQAGGSNNGSSWKIQSKATETFVDLFGGFPADGTAIEAFNGSWTDGNGHQLWTFEPLSLKGQDTLVASAALSQDFKNYLPGGFRLFFPAATVRRYLLLQQDTLTKIWGDSGIGKNSLRNWIFDYDAFATVFKGEVAKWGAATFKANGFTILCGMMFARQLGAEHAYNWVVDVQDRTSVVFFDPRTGQFSADAGGYEAYVGLF
ncbi:hypothetical protein C8Q74DRAFT_1366583 [Fomes fomentarius]|nr:hypothetical protein C8Q74DRAFT_1366583 [Fomes fomentarius]